MQDSIELPPSDEQNQQINFFISPNNSLKKPKQGLINTASQESLAYSSQTFNAKYKNIDRSPDQIQIPNFQASERPQKLSKLLRAGKAETERTPILKQTQSDNNLLNEGFASQEHGFRKDRIKTVNKNEYNILSKKYKQLEYALHLQIITSEELRTKVAILAQLLEQKMKQSELSYFLKMKNSSKNLKNIDIFVQLKQSQKKLKQTQLIVEQQKQQIQQLMEKSRFKSASKENMDINNYDPKAQIEALMEQKESLFNYIEEMKKYCNSKEKQTQQVLQELQRHQEKQQKFITIERPKLIQEVTERSELIKQLQQQIEQIRMEKNLMELNYENQLQQVKSSRHKQNGMESQKSAGTMTAQITHKSIQLQTDFNDDESQVLKAELKILKSQRDYYIKQFKKKLNESSQNYILKLKIKNYQQNFDIQAECS